MGRGRSNDTKRSQLLLLVVLLAILGGAGTWNYQRNLAAEAQEVRPYRTLSDADVATLIGAYEAEIAELRRRHERAAQQRASARADGDRFRQFERAQQRGRSVRELGYQLSEREAALAELRAEQQRRAGQGDELQQFLKRLLTIEV